MMLRLVRPDELAVVATIARDAFSPYIPQIGKPPAPMLADFRAAMGRGHLWTLRSIRPIEGYLHAYQQRGSFEIETIAVHPDSQGKGLGQQMLVAVEALARSRQCTEICLYTNAAMADNIAWYRQTGFSELDRRVEDGFSRVYLHKSLHVN